MRCDLEIASRDDRLIRFCYQRDMKQVGRVGKSAGGGKDLKGTREVQDFRIVIDVNANV
jgi:hypothetical protein